VAERACKLPVRPVWEADTYLCKYGGIYYFVRKLKMPSEFDGGLSETFTLVQLFPPVSMVARYLQCVVEHRRRPKAYLLGLQVRCPTSRSLVRFPEDPGRPCMNPAGGALYTWALNIYPPKQGTLHRKTPT
jgi:hypothetical protein